MSTFAEHVIAYNNALHYEGELPKGIRIMNPFKESSDANALSAVFYRKFYNDNHPRKLILGINPGRFGAGATGIPFTDPKRLVEFCEIPCTGKVLHEPSSVFIYDMINAYGGPRAFYSHFYIHSVCPLGFVSVDDQGKETNYNYYDSKELQHDVLDFIIDNIQNQLKLDISKEVCFCLGTGQNASFLMKLNERYQFFKRIVPLDHPRFVMQYKSKSKQEYIDKYLRLLMA